MPAASDRMIELNAKSARVRGARAALRRALREDPRRVRDVLLDPPDYIHAMPIVEVIMLTQTRPTVMKSLPRAGRLAAAARVNLLERVGRAPRSERVWVAGALSFTRCQRGWEMTVSSRAGQRARVGDGTREEGRPHG